jgi:hypothetical protein
MRARAVQLIVSVLFLSTACGSLDEHVRRFKAVYVAVVSSVPALRDTADSCGGSTTIDLAFTNPSAQRVRVTLTYRAFDAEGANCTGFASGAWFRRSSTWCLPEKALRDSRAPPSRDSSYTTSRSMLDDVQTEVAGARSEELLLMRLGLA